MKMQNKYKTVNFKFQLVTVQTGMKKMDVSV